MSKAPDLYGILEVGADATPSEIKKAYRRLAKKHHPDAGGSKVDFENIHAAYAVLSDPMKRDHYDRTGEIKDDGPDHAVEIIVSLFDTLLEQDVPLHIDYVKLMKESLKETRQRISDMLDRYKAQRKKYDNMRIRFKTKKKGTNNVLKGVLDNKISHLDHEIDRLAGTLVQTDRAADLLDGYMFLTDSAPTVQTSPFTWTFRHG